MVTRAALKAPASAVLVCTTSTLSEAQRLARSLVEARLAACVSCIPGATSYYRWKKQIERAKETVLIIKTKHSLLPAAMKHLKQRHSYTVPELIAWPIVAGDPQYLHWLQEECRG